MLDKIIFIIVMLAYYEVESKEDAILSGLKQTVKENRAWHITSVTLLGIMTMAVIYALFGISWIALIATIYAALLRMSYFNIRLNMKRERPVFHLGSLGWDGLLKKHEKLYFITVIILTVISTILFILL